jgi:hypothetical protein
MPVLEKTDIAWQRDIIEKKREYKQELAELEELKREYRKIKEAFQDFEYAMSDAYENKRVSSYKKAYEFQSMVGSFLQKLAHAIPDDAVSAKRIVKNFERLWNSLLPEHVTRLFVQKRAFLFLGPMTIKWAQDAPTHFQWILGQLKDYRKVWSRLDSYIDSAIKEARAHLSIRVA